MPIGWVKAPHGPLELNKLPLQCMCLILICLSHLVRIECPLFYICDILNLLLFTAYSL